MQVLIAFGFSAYLTLALVLIHYLVDHQQQQNSIDRAFLAAVVPRKLKFQSQQSSERWTRAFDAAVLLLGDTQIVTSVAILLSGYIQLPCGLSAYHWEMIVDLAWFSAVTHLTALTSLRHYFRRRPAMALWRVIFMGVSMVLLGSALYPIGFIPQYFYYFEGPPYPTPIYTEAAFVGLLSSPVICLTNSHRRAELSIKFEAMSALAKGSEQRDPMNLPFNILFVTVSLAYFAVGYITRVARLFAPLSNRANHWLRVAPVRLLCRFYESAARRNPIPSCRILWQLWKGFWLICIVMSQALYEIVDSTLWEIVWLAAALAFGTLRLIGHKRTFSPSGENTWGFGQVLALILSALPLWSFISTLQDTVHRPLSIQITTTGLPDVTGLDRLGHRHWFNGLVGFLFGTTLFFMLGTICIFALSFLNPRFSLTGDALHYHPANVLIVYAVLSSCSLLVATFLVSLALAFHFNIIGSLNISSWWRRRTMDWGTLAQQKVRRQMWILLICVLLAAQSAALTGVYHFIHDPSIPGDV